MLPLKFPVIVSSMLAYSLAFLFSVTVGVNSPSITNVSYCSSLNGFVNEIVILKVTLDFEGIISPVLIPVT